MRISDWSSDVCSSDLLMQDGTLARRFRGDLHVQRLVVERYEETRTAHAAQLIEHHWAIAQRQRTEVADACRHRLRQAAGAGEQAFHLAGAQLGQPDKARQADRKNTRLNSSHSCATRMPSLTCTNKNNTN